MGMMESRVPTPAGRLNTSLIAGTTQKAKTTVTGRASPAQRPANITDAHLVSRPNATLIRSSSQSPTASQTVSVPDELRWRDVSAGTTQKAKTPVTGFASPAQRPANITDANLVSRPNATSIRSSSQSPTASQTVSVPVSTEHTSLGASTG